MSKNFKNIACHFCQFTTFLSLLVMQLLLWYWLGCTNLVQSCTNLVQQDLGHFFLPFTLKFLLNPWNNYQLHCTMQIPNPTNLCPPQYLQTCTYEIHFYFLRGFIDTACWCVLLARISKRGPNSSICPQSTEQQAAVMLSGLPVRRGARWPTGLVQVKRHSENLENVANTYKINFALGGFLSCPRWLFW